MPRLTKRVVDAARPDPADHYFIWDDELPGFGVRIIKAGGKTYQVQYRLKGRTRRMSLGAHGKLTVEEARKMARDLLGRVARGEDPAEERREGRSAPTMKITCERFLSEYVPHHCKASTATEYRRSVDLFILPALGSRRITDIERADIARLHHDMRDKPYQANRTLGVLSVLFNQAEVWGLRPDGSNPCRHVRKYTEEKRERFLTEEELQRLWSVLEACEAEGSESPSAVNAFRLLILTGCRLSEIQTLQWDHVSPGGFHLPDSKTGAKKVYIGQSVHDLLATLPRQEGNPYVLPGALPGSPLSDLQKPWRRIRKRAGLEDLRIHDLRHSFASFGLANGLTLAEIGKLLGHTQVQTTARYAHLAEKHANQAAERVTSTISGLTQICHSEKQLKTHFFILPSICLRIL